MESPEERLSRPITFTAGTAIVHLPIQSGTPMTKFISLNGIIIISKASTSPKQLHTGIYLTLCPEFCLTIPSANFWNMNKDKLRL